MPFQSHINRHALVGAALLALSLCAIALGLVIIGIMIYLAFRFEWKFSVAAIVANLHDVIIILGFFAFFQREFSLAVLAAVLASFSQGREAMKESAEQAGRHAVVVAPDAGGVQLADHRYRFARIRAIADQVAAAQHGVIPGGLGASAAGVERFDVGMDVTQDEKAHSV